MSTRRPWKFRTAPTTAILDQPDAMRLEESWHTRSRREITASVTVRLAYDIDGPIPAKVQKSADSNDRRHSEDPSARFWRSAAWASANVTCAVFDLTIPVWRRWC